MYISFPNVCIFEVFLLFFSIVIIINTIVRSKVFNFIITSYLTQAFPFFFQIILAFIFVKNPRTQRSSSQFAMGFLIFLKHLVRYL